MQEPVFLLIVMAITALGVRMFLGQLNGTPLRLPRPRLRLRLPRLPALPSLPGKGRPKRARRRRRRDEGFDDDAYEQGTFAPGRSPFVAVPASPGVDLLHRPAPEAPVAYEDEYDEDGYLPPNQVDFFADDAVTEPRPAVRRMAAMPEDTGGSVVTYATTSGADSALEPVIAESPAVYEVPAEPEIDPNDIMSFFEKPAASTQLPETLREEIQTVTASELLAEARQLRSLLSRDAA